MKTGQAFATGDLQQSTSGARLLDVPVSNHGEAFLLQNHGITITGSVAFGFPPSEPHREAPGKATARAVGLDDVAIAAVCQAIDDLEPADAMTAELQLVALKGHLGVLWETCADASIWHQDILAALEAAVRTIMDEQTLTDAMRDAFREAASDLAQPTLVKENAAFIRAHFRRLGVMPPAFLGDEDR